MTSRLRLLVLLPFAGLLITAAPALATANTEDKTAPVVTAVRMISATDLAPGDVIEAEIAVSDPSGVREVTLWFQDAQGQPYNVSAVAGEDLASEGTVTVRRTIDTSWSSGAYTLHEIGAGDLLFNYAGHLDTGALAVNYAAITFNVDNPDAPARTAPVVDSLRRVGRFAAGAGQEIRTVVRTSSADGYVRGIDLYFRGPDGVARSASASVFGSGRDSLAGETLVVVRPQADWAAGLYTLEQIVVSGFDGRTAAFYHRSGDVGRIPDGPARHTLDLAALDLRVTPRG